MKAFGALTAGILVAAATSLSPALAAAATSLSPALAAAPGAWAERVQIVFRADTGSVERRLVRVWNPWPEKNLEFVWEPRGPAVLGADGTAGGRGRLVWRVRGSASYDPKSVFATYAGEMREGRPHGRGRLELRSGEIFDGGWLAGSFTGTGFHVDAAGDRFEGSFADGLLDGAGRELKATGEIFEGRFVAGLRDGPGRTRLPGGTVYESAWSKGLELGDGRPDALADALVGGLLRAQAGGGDAGKVEIAVSVDQRLNSQADMRYTHLVQEEDIAILPESQEMNDAWNGTGEITPYSGAFTGIDWEDAPAFVDVELATSDGSRVRYKRLEMQVEQSEAYLKPMLTLVPHLGCVGFRPSFSFQNHGWGDVRTPRITVQFTGAEPGGPASRSFSGDLTGFDGGTDILLGDVLAEAGVDTAKLAGERFTCPSVEGLNVCRSKLFNEVSFGEIAEFVWGEDQLFTTAVGTLDYSWADAAGNVYGQSEPFRVDIALATIEVPKELAECGDGAGGAPEALRFQEVHFPLGRSNFTIDMPMRGNRNLSKYTARLKLSSDQTSYHRFRIAAELADGSVRQSKPVSFYHFRPRPSDYQPAPPEQACYLPETNAGC